MFDVVALGEAIVDFTEVGTSASGQKLFEQNAGGAPANVLMTLNKCGRHTAFVGKVGDDMQGQFMKATLKEAGINISGMVVDKSVYTTLSFVSRTKEGERSFSFARKPGADSMLTKDEVKSSLLVKCNILHVGSVTLTKEPSREATMYAVEHVKEYGGLISYDPNYRDSLWTNKRDAKKHMRAVLPYVDFLKMSEEELKLITDEAQIETAAQKLVATGIQIVVITLGAKGAYVCNEDGGLYVKGFKAKVVDTTAAGDAFWGAFLYKLLLIAKTVEDVSIEELADCALFGNAVGSLCVEKNGGIPSIPDFEIAKKRYLEAK